MKTLYNYHEEVHSALSLKFFTVKILNIHVHSRIHDDSQQMYMCMVNMQQIYMNMRNTINTSVHDDIQHSTCTCKTYKIEHVHVEYTTNIHVHDEYTANVHIHDKYTINVDVQQIYMYMMNIYII